MKEKIICITDDDMSEINDYLEDGWTIGDMKVCGCNDYTSCYVRLIRFPLK